MNTMTMDKHVDYRRSLTEQAVLVTMETKTPSFRKINKQAGEELCLDKKTRKDRAKVLTIALNEKSMAPFTSVIDEARKSVFYFYTVDWMGTARLCMMPVFQTMVDQFNELKAKAYKNFLIWCDEDYEAEIENARRDMGQLFDRSIYPSREEIRKEFEMKLEIMQVPESDLRVKIGNTMAKQAREQERERMQRVIERPFRDLVERGRQFLKRLDMKADTRHDTTAIETLRRIVETAPKLDVTGRLQAICNPLLSSLPIMDAEIRSGDRAKEFFRNTVQHALTKVEEEIDLLSADID